MRLALTFFGILFLLSSSAAGSNAVLRAIAELNAFHNRQCASDRTFDLTGTVCHAEDIHLILEDETCCSWVYLRPDATNDFHRGERYRLSGTAICDATTEPRLTVLSEENVGRADPRPPVDVRIGDIDEIRLSFADIRTTGVVMDVLADEIDARYNLLLLKDGAARIPVSVKTAENPDTGSLVGARVSVVGTFFRGIRGIRKYTGPVIVSQSVTVIEHPPADPFVTTPRLEASWYLTPREVSALDSRRICGRVLARWSGDRLLVRNDDGRNINVRLARGTRPPLVNVCVEAIGYPQTDIFARAIQRAVARNQGRSPNSRTGRGHHTGLHPAAGQRPSQHRKRLPRAARPAARHRPQSAVRRRRRKAPLA